MNRRIIKQACQDAASMSVARRPFCSSVTSLRRAGARYAVSLLIWVTIVGVWAPNGWADDAAVKEGFRQPQRNYQWSFPGDHGLHAGFQTEWWYYTGQLYSADTKPFVDKPLYGFQLTFFKRQMVAGEPASAELLAHAAITDLISGKTTFAVRRGGALLGAAGIRAGTLGMWSGDWTADLISNTLVLSLSLNQPEPVELKLLGSVLSPIWLQGEGGYSRKGSCADCASHYYSLPRLSLTGELRRGEKVTALHGIGWMDHEFMSNSLDQDQVGWDWLGLMLKDGRSLTVFRLRNQQGGVSFASGAITTDGATENIEASDIIFLPSDEWRSESGTGRYPTKWRIQIASKGIDLTVAARSPRCEIGEGGNDLEPRYWEGPVASTDESVIGYLEMTGYAGKVRV